MKTSRDFRVVFPFAMAIMCCAGFVFLKVCAAFPCITNVVQLGDHYLATHAAIFKLLSGHFWSKMCDFLQIHWVLVFFQRCYEDFHSKDEKSK